MQLSEITPLILTFNEAPNIRRTLGALEWASRIVIVDSYSTDATLAIAAEFGSVQVYQREFDHFSTQCNFGLSLITSPWVLSLDADYICPSELRGELLELDGTRAGYSARFHYGVYGKPLRAALYPPRVVLYQRQLAMYFQDGHAHRVAVDGTIGTLQSPIMHDDRKPFSRWCDSQIQYAEQEAKKILSTSAEKLDWKDRMRRLLFIAPFGTLMYCLFWKALLLDGWRGMFYTGQRVFAELLLSLNLLDRSLRERGPVE